MSINLALILTLLTALSGVVIALDKFVWKTQDEDDRRRNRDRKPPAAQVILVEYARSFFPVLVFVLVIRSFVFEPFRIPSGSMKPTLWEGDFIFVKKFSYGLRLPVTETKILETGDPLRGDVVVFRLPSDPSINYIKRVVGLPGDVVHYERHRLTINGELVDFQANGEFFEGYPEYTENLDGRVHRALVSIPGRPRDGDGTYTIPDGYYFMMGDNRDNSTDSRWIGPIAEEFLVGEAVRIWMHWTPWDAPKWGRIGTKIE